MPLELSITNEQEIVVRLNPRTGAQKPSSLDGPAVWTVNSGPAKITPATDGLSCKLTSDDTDLSDTIVQVTADADLGAGVEKVADTILLHTTHANATSLGLTSDEPTIKP